MAVSEPYTDEAGEVVIRVAKERECWAALREDHRVGTPWPVRQIEVVSPLAGPLARDERTKELRQEPEGAEPRSGTPGPQEGARRPWWRRVFGA